MELSPTKRRVLRRACIWAPEGGLIVRRRSPVLYALLEMGLVELRNGRWFPTTRGMLEASV